MAVILPFIGDGVPGAPDENESQLEGLAHTPS